MYIRLGKGAYRNVTSFQNVVQKEKKFQMFREVEGIEIFWMSRGIVPENSRCISNCLFTRIGTHFRYV